MFMSAIARPRTLPDGTYWDGKIGIWPFGKFEPAKRDSVNRKKGTLEWKNQSVDTEEYRSMMLNNVIPAICNKWPAGEFSNPHMKIRVQQDGAPAHFDEKKDEEWIEYLEAMGLTDKLVLYTQPPNSPDLNCNDLGFFHAIDAVYQRENPKKHGDIIACVERAYWAFDPKRLNHIWLTHMSVMNETLKAHGNNDFKIPHMKKQQLERNGMLPKVLDAVEEARDMLQVAQSDAEGAMVE
ncbi:transposon protein [Seminavis robusta]|uniref:Transposon protein n=1 Tax=Seminavis robusta TaxID=568900 RepID=A0A9N8HZD5_9STRA|nr:transposon protein [Seminavis robusta]|eukprot:Sro2867_g339010.1 transposon protein (238) ;mRNA; r:2008-2721